MRESVVLDTSAILAMIDDEEGSERVEGCLRCAQKGQGDIFACFVTLTEIRYVTMQERDEASADAVIGLVKAWPLKWIHSDEQLCLLAARFKAEHAMSLADAFVAATAFRLGATLMHKDPEFESLRPGVKLLALPYKSRRK